MTELSQAISKTVTFKTYNDYLNAPDEIRRIAERITINRSLVKDKLKGTTGVPLLLAMIDQWGRDRNIIGDGEPQAQLVKFVEEFSEILESDDSMVIADGIGDSIVVLVQLAGTTGEVYVTEQPPLHEEIIALGVDTTDYELLRHGVLILGRLATAVARKDKEKTQAQIDAMMSLLATWAISENLALFDCVQMAYNEIKDRKGILLDGIFIKSTDARYDDAVAIAESRKVSA